MDLESSCLKNSCITYTREPSNGAERLDLLLCLSKWRMHIEPILAREKGKLASHRHGIKFQLSAHVELKKFVYNEEGESTPRFIDPYFNSESFRYDSQNYDENVDEMLLDILGKFDAFVASGSGYTLQRVLKLSLKIYHFRLLRGGSKLCPQLVGKRACLSISCLDDRCFLYSCLAAIHPKKKHADRPWLYNKYIPELNVDGIELPVRLNQIPRFERLNPSLSINVFGYERNLVIPLYHTQKRTARFDINLLLYKGHYYLIRHLSRLLSQQSGLKNRYFYCHWCLLSYHTKSALEDHDTLCRRKLQRLKPPKSSEPICFKNYSRMFFLPFIIFYDIEATLQRIGDEEQSHSPVSVCSFTVCQHARYTEKPKVFTGENCIEQFLKHLRTEARRIDDLLQTTNAPMRVNADDLNRYNNTTVCDICKTSLESSRKCMDHDHLSPDPDSNLRYVTCSRCNLTFGRRATRIPVVAHNAMAYDINHIICKLEDASYVRVLAKNTERFLCLHWGRHLTFIDSLNFLGGSLDSLSSKIPDDVLDKYLFWLTDHDPYKQGLLKHKAVLPYDYLDCMDKLAIDELPPRDTFYNRLTEKELDAESHRRAQNIWHVFQCRTLKDYLELYVTLDVLLLAAVFETYRESTFRHFKLDPAHYVSSPSLCFDAMLKLTEVNLDVLRDTEMYLFFTKSIRGGMSGSSVRYAAANNDLLENYDPEKQVSHIMSFDANNLYGHSLSMPLPMSDFRWLEREEIADLDIESHPRTDPIGYFLEVDLEYPEVLHDLHNEFPLAPEKTAVSDTDLSDFMRDMKKQLNLARTSGGMKLMATLRDKSRYILHYEALKLYLRLGLRLKRVHRCISFRQGPFLKRYIALNNKCRKKATNNFEVSLYKLYNNCIYGKTIYNVFKQVNIKLVSDAAKFRRLAAMPTFTSSYRVTEQLASVAMKSACITCDKPIYVGAAVLDLSKCHMYSFYYDYLVPMYSRTGLRLLYTDTDSFYLQIFERPDLYRDILEHEEFFDRSNYAEHHFLHSTSRKMALGLMKDEHANDPIAEMCCLRSKMYAVRTEGDANDLRAKGLKRHLLRELSIDDYKKCLQKHSTTTHEYLQIRSKRHRLSTTLTRKIGLSPYDDKRYLLPCGIHTLAYGHYKIRSGQLCDICDTN